LPASKLAATISLGVSAYNAVPGTGAKDQGETMFEKPEQVLQSWLEGINSGELDKPISLYADHAVLLPTFSNKGLIELKDKQGYFAKLAGYEDLSVVLHNRTLHSQHLSSKLYLLSGIYCWRFEIEGEPLNFEARFSMAMDLDKTCPIIHHHSSQVPRML
jgi:hypothetical protein